MNELLILFTDYTREPPRPRPVYVYTYEKTDFMGTRTVFKGRTATGMPVVAYNVKPEMKLSRMGVYEREPWYTAEYVHFPQGEFPQRPDGDGEETVGSWLSTPWEIYHAADVFLKSKADKPTLAEVREYVQLRTNPGVREQAIEPLVVAAHHGLTFKTTLTMFGYPDSDKSLSVIHFIPKLGSARSEPDPAREPEPVKPPSEWWWDVLDVSRVELPDDMEAAKRVVMRNFREKAKVAHPDKGGSQKEFVRLLEAREKAMSYVSTLSVGDGFRLVL